MIFLSNGLGLSLTLRLQHELWEKKRVKSKKKPVRAAYRRKPFELGFIRGFDELPAKIKTYYLEAKKLKKDLRYLPKDLTVREAGNLRKRAEGLDRFQSVPFSPLIDEFGNRRAGWGKLVDTKIAKMAQKANFPPKKRK